jgi:uncharacterized membrane protein YqjE
MRIKIYDGHSMVQIRLEMRVSTTVILWRIAQCACLWNFFRYINGVDMK